MKNPKIKEKEVGEGPFKKQFPVSFFTNLILLHEHEMIGLKLHIDSGALSNNKMQKTAEFVFFLVALHSEGF